jgi:hypothetical protein
VTAPLADAPDLLGALQTAAPDAGWTGVWDATLGEYYLQELLISEGLSLSRAQAAAAGWGGDNVQIYRSDAGEYAYRVALAWDDAAEAAEFAELTADLDVDCRAQACWVTDPDAGISVLLRAPEAGFAAALLERSATP